jgi:hypothetical protein
MTTPPPTWEHDIQRPFRPKDVESMSWKFDLSSCDDVRKNAEQIYAALANGRIPCDGAWPPANVARLRAWIDAGTPR